MSTPIARLMAWLDEARDAGIADWDAMVLATAAKDCAPSARVVLCRGIDDQGIRFYTSYESHKGADLAANARAALVFFWPALARQARVEGSVEKLSPEASDAYFHSRPRGHQIGALASEQSHTIASIDALRARALEIDREYAGREVPRPARWGGYLVRPRLVELWTRGEDRLHERRLFTKDDRGAWTETLLAP